MPLGPDVQMPHPAQVFDTGRSRAPSPARCNLMGGSEEWSAEAEAERLAGEMADEWSAGGRPGAEAYLSRLPGVAGHPRAATRLIYEEICLRESLGEDHAAPEVRGRFPQWAGELDLLIDCHALFKEDAGLPSFPEPGDTLGGYLLLDELGRGVLGRVFLATQPDLANRPVVLKVTPRTGEEHLSLARLQHTNIVPLYAVHDLNDEIRALCMPYLGGVTLARILGELSETPPERRTGGDVLGVVVRADRESAADLRPAGPAGPAGSFLARCSYAQAVCWIGACLADALQYAHDRGLLHLDLKPGNVLLSGDLQPMLLDFHMARGPLAPGCRAPDRLGGTPGFMSPEQGAAIAAVQAGGCVTEAVDGRSDVYALGVLLYQALAGMIPIDFGASAATLPGANRQVSVGLADVLARCLARDPRARYPDAATLAEDLRRHLADRPLVGVPNRSPSERWRKWRRRHPAAPPVVGLLAMAVVTSALAGASAWGHIERRRAEAWTALEEGRRLLYERQPDGAVRALSRGAEAVRGLPGSAHLAGLVDERLRLARRAAMARAVHSAAEGLSYLAGSESPSGSEAGVVEAGCRAVRDARRQILDPGGPLLPPADERLIRADLDELDLLLADVRRGATGGGLQAWDAAATTTTDAPGTARECYLQGRSLLQDGETRRAADWFGRALAARPDWFWPNFYRGVCDYRTGRLAGAVSAFGTCIALDPRSAPSYANRALALTALGRFEEALKDCGRALAIEPGSATASLCRVLILAHLGRHSEALEGLKDARARGADPSRVAGYAELVRRAREGRAGASGDLLSAMRNGFAPRPEGDPPVGPRTRPGGPAL